LLVGFFKNTSIRRPASDTQGRKSHPITLRVPDYQ
jgi:hypothetical protein